MYILIVHASEEKYPKQCLLKCIIVRTALMAYSCSVNSENAIYSLNLHVNKLNFIIILLFYLLEIFIGWFIREKIPIY